MMTKKKLVVATLSSALMLSAVIAGGTYALFTSSAQNTGNTFKSGTLTLSTHRNDVPIEGPMFYTSDSDAGRMGTGLWAPKDTHTRAMLIKNKGSLDAKLTDVIAIPEGNPDQQANALAFGDQAMVTVAALTTGGVTLDASDIDSFNLAADRAFKDLMKGPKWMDAIARGGQEVFAVAREFWLNWEYRVDANGQSISVGVSDIYIGSLEDLYNSGNGNDAILPNLVLKSGKTMHLAYNVTFLDDEGQTFVNNDIQGKVVNFKFKNSFEQVKNN